jgi:hypothetical protein
VEVEQAAFLGHQKSEILLGRDLGNLAEGLVLSIVVADLGAAVALGLEGGNCRSAMRNASWMAVRKSGC